MGKQIPQLNVFGEVIPATTHLHQFGDGQNFDCVHSDDLYGALLIYTIPQHTFHCQERPGAQMLTSNEAQMFNDTRQKKDEWLRPPHPPSPPSPLPILGTCTARVQTVAKILLNESRHGSGTLLLREASKEQRLDG